MGFEGLFKLRDSVSVIMLFKTGAKAGACLRKIQPAFLFRQGKELLKYSKVFRKTEHQKDS